MAVDATRHHHLQGMHQRSVQEGMTNQEGVDAFQRILSQSSLPQVIVATQGLDGVFTIAETAYSLKGLTSMKGFGTTHARPEISCAYVPPTHELERRLCEIWQRTLGFQEIGIFDDFFELGGHSLLAARLVGEMSDELGREVSLGALYRAPHVAALAELVGDLAEPVESLVPIQPGGTRPPLFCVHPAGGSLQGLAGLAGLLGPDQPIYALRSRALFDPALEHPTLDAMLDAYAGSLCEAQSRGSFHLLGWSLGGRLALALAARLERQGRHVQLVQCWGTAPPAVDGASRDPLDFFGGILAGALSETDGRSRRALLEELAGLDDARAEERLVAWLRESGAGGGDVAAEILERAARLASRHVALLSGWPGERLAAAVHRIGGRRGPAGDEDAWRTVAGGELRWDTLRIDHLEMLSPQGLEAVATAAKPVLYEKQGRVAFA